MQTSADGRKFIAAMEGNVLEVYLDSSDYPTAGVGHLLTAAERAKMPLGTKITREQSDAYLAADLKTAEDAVNTIPNLNQNQFDALVSLVFNIGTSNFKRSKLRRLLDQGQFDAAANEFAKWNKSKGQVVAGLTKRRRRERAYFLTPSAAVSPEQPQPTQPDTPVVQSPTVEQPSILNQIEDGVNEYVQPVDQITNIGNKISQRGDALKALKSTLYHSLGQPLWGVLAWILGLPWYVYAIVAVLAAIAVYQYIHRQNKLGAIRERK